MYFVVAAIFGIICALIAYSKGRNPIGWFFIGFLIGVFGLILVLVVSNLKEARQKEAHVQMEQRRLSEQLRQERLKSEQLRKHTQVRLDAHDRELKIDTRHIGPLLQKADLQPILESGQGSSEETLRAGGDTRSRGWYWYSQEGDNAAGPVSLEKLRQLIAEGKIDSSTWVWHESLDEWTAAGEVGDLGREIDRG
jgi:type II secretory pathway pseudopilin PulG